MGPYAGLQIRAELTFDNLAWASICVGARSRNSQASRRFLSSQASSEMLIRVHIDGETSVAIGESVREEDVYIIQVAF